MWASSVTENTNYVIQSSKFKKCNKEKLFSPQKAQLKLKLILIGDDSFHDFSTSFGMKHNKYG